jgi:predicted phosphodiesterase
MKITLISDTHNKHNQVTATLPGGDLLLHAGDATGMGYKHELQQFMKWYNNLDYTTKSSLQVIMIGGFKKTLK